MALATITGTLYRNSGPSTVEVPHARGRVQARALLLDETGAIVESGTPVTAHADAAGLVTLHLWPGAWRVTLPDGEIIDGADHTGIVVEAGGTYDLHALRGYVPGPGVTTTLIPLGAVAATSLPAGSEPTAAVVDGVLTWGIPAPDLSGYSTTDHDHDGDYDPAGTAAAAVAAVTPASIGAATAAQGAKADASDVHQITLTGPLTLTIPAEHPAGQVYRVALTQDASGGHTVTYGGVPVTVDLTAGASTLVELWPASGGGWSVTYPGAGAGAAAASESALVAATMALSRTVADPTRHTPKVVSLIHGGSVSPVTTNCTAATVPGGFQGSPSALRLTSAGGASSYTVRVDLGAPFAMGAAQCLDIAITIPDITVVDTVSINLYHDAGRTAAYAWSRSNRAAPIRNLVNGLNVLRFPAPLYDSGYTQSASTWGAPYAAEVRCQKVGGAWPPAGTTVTIQHLWAEVQAKAKLLVVADRGYRSWYQSCYPQLRTLGIPVTWAPDLTLFGSNPGTIFEAITEAEMHALAKENGNSISFHGRTGGATSGLTAQQLADETAYCVNWLRGHSYQGRLWRAAYVQNNAPASDDPLVTSQLLGSAYSVTALAGTDTYQMWPPYDQYHIYRTGIEVANTSATNQANLTSWFDRLKLTHGLACIFFHRLNEVDTASTRQADWDFFVGKVTTGLAEGWLEGVTFEDLYYGSGGVVEQRNGQAVSAWPLKPTQRVLL